MTSWKYFRKWGRNFLTYIITARCLFRLRQNYSKTPFFFVNTFQETRNRARKTQLLSFLYMLFLKFRCFLFLEYAHLSVRLFKKKPQGLEDDLNKYSEETSQLFFLLLFQMMSARERYLSSLNLNSTPGREVFAWWSRRSWIITGNLFGRRKKLRWRRIKNTFEKLICWWIIWRETSSQKLGRHALHRRA